MSGKEELSGCFNVVNVYPERGVIEVTNPKAKTDNEKYKIFTYDGVYDTRLIDFMIVYICSINNVYYNVQNF